MVFRELAGFAGRTLKKLKRRGKERKREEETKRQREEETKRGRERKKEERRGRDGGRKTKGERAVFFET